MTIAALGLALRRYQRPLLTLQWAVLAFYLCLLIIPALRPLPTDDAKLTDDLTRFAQFVFWGIWWPFVIISVMVLGRSWCGLLCPEGFLTEWASRHGRGGSIPKWLRWPGWPLTAFTLTTVYGQLISVYEYPKAMLLILGGSTLVALVIGFLYGRGKRVWCRYLCPVSGVFGVLAKLAPLHFAVDRSRWAAAAERTPAVDCPPLLNVRNLTSNQHCQMCGRCAGHRDAVQLSWRSHAIEIVQLHDVPAPIWEARLIVFGLLGLATSAFVWTVSPWFVALKQQLAIWLLNHGADAVLNADAPWWLLTHYPAVNDAFSWLDGLSIMLFLIMGTFALGGFLWCVLHLLARLIGAGFSSAGLAQSLIPLAGINLFLGLSALTSSQLHAEGWLAHDLNPIRAALLLAASLLSLRLLWRQLATIHWRRRLIASLLLTIAILPLHTIWALAWWGW